MISNYIFIININKLKKSFNNSINIYNKNIN